MKKILAVIAIIAVIAGGYLFFEYQKSNRVVSPLGKGSFSPIKKLAPYSYSALHQTVFPGSNITIDKTIKDEENFSSHVFYFTVNGKKVSGLLNIPKKPGDYPVIVMIRGYVDKSMYEPGMGTVHGGEYLAQNGFITVAPDFLGYATSDKASTDAMEDRLLTYVTTLDLFSSLKNLNAALAGQSLAARFDGKHIGLWGHSNGGQIALSVLEVSGYDYPTVLWAPVSKPFPYSILYYTDDIDDHGKALRKVVADFEKDYDAEKYSLTNYLDWINAPIQLHQGEADESVPLAWSDLLAKTLADKKKDVEYFTYPGENHNFDRGDWPQVMARTMAFYQQWFAKK